VTSPALKPDQVASLVRARIADATLRPGMLAPSAAVLAKETGFGTLTCQKALLRLFKEGALTRMSRSTRYRIAGAPPGEGLELSLALAARRHAAGLTQPKLASAIGVSVTTVGHAETGRLWQSRRFWERADLALNASGQLLAMFDAWRSSSPAGTTAGEPDPPTACVEPGVPDGVVITLSCAPGPVTVRWADGSSATVPGPVPAQRGPS